MTTDLTEDTSSPEAIVNAMYRLISGRAGEPRDWSRWLGLHATGARLIPIERADDGVVSPRVMAPEQFIASRSPFFARQSFFEYETSREERRFGSLAHVWSSYDASEEPGGPIIRRGVNSIQLWNDGNRWWIVSVAWDAIKAAEV